MLLFPEFATPEQIAASQQIDAEVAAASSGAARQIEPWNSRLDRCLPQVQSLLEIGSFLAANCGEEDEDGEEEALVDSFSADAEKEARIERYSLDAELDRLIQFIPANVRLT